jgi:hypothetical protein
MSKKCFEVLRSYVSMNIETSVPCSDRSKETTMSTSPHTVTELIALQWQADVRTAARARHGVPARRSRERHAGRGLAWVTALVAGRKPAPAPAACCA